MNLARLWKRHGTKVLGYITSTIPAVLLIDGLIPPAHQKFYLLALVLLGGGVVKRGHTNSTNEGNTP
jgi:hypothetical protein